MKPSEVINKHSKDILALALQYGLNNVRVFGSSLHGKDTLKSDLDLLVNAPTGTTLLDLIGLQQAIEDEFGIEVDVLTEKELPGSFREQVIAEARLL